MDLDGLRQLFTSQVESLRQRFDRQDRTLERIEEQTTKTNGRADRLEIAMAAALERLNGHDVEFRDMKRAHDANDKRDSEQFREMVQSAVATLSAAIPNDAKAKVTIEAQSGENRGITQRDVWIVLGAIAVAVAVMKAIGLLHFAAGTS